MLAAFRSLCRYSVFNPVRQKLQQVDPRYFRAGLTSATSGLAAIAGLLVTLFTVPLILRDLGQVGYGLYATISSSVSMFAWADLGIGLSVLNALSRCMGRDDTLSAQQYVSSALAALLLISTVVGAICLGVALSVGWAQTLKVPIGLAGQTRSAVLVLICGICVAMPCGLASRIPDGISKGLYKQHL